LHAFQQQAEAKAREAYQKGVQQGDATARQQLGAQQEAAMQRLGRTIEEISGMRQRCRYAAEEDVVKLALAIARRILHRELTVDPSAILGLVKAALAGLDVRELHRIRIHPGQAGPLRTQLEAMGLPQRCEVVGDAALERGAAILETTHGSVDASVETQLEEIERGFSDLIRRAT
jgi:flagellar assembly protein FliH